MSDGTLTAVEGAEPVVAYQLLGPERSVLAEHLPQQTFTPASTLKLAVLIAAARALEAGELALDQPVPAVSRWSSLYDGSEFQFDGDEVDPDWPTDDRDLPLGEILERMIVVSSNEATNVVYDLVGADSIAQVFADAGCQHSALKRKYGDMLAARHLGGVSACTAGDLAALMAAAVGGDLVNKQWTRFITELLGRQQDAVIGAVVEQTWGAESYWGSKSGWVDRIRHDVAYMGTPGGADYVLAVCTRGFPDHPSAVAAIRALTRGLLQSLEAPH